MQIIKEKFLKNFQKQLQAEINQNKNGVLVHAEPSEESKIIHAMSAAAHHEPEKDEIVTIEAMKAKLERKQKKRDLKMQMK